MVVQLFLYAKSNLQQIEIAAADKACLSVAQFDR